MELTQLGKEYLHTAAQLKERINDLTPQLKTAQVSELKQLEDRIAYLKAEYYQMTDVGKQLLFYYGERYVC